MRFKQWINESKQFPLKKLAEINQNTHLILVCCDKLQDLGFDTKPVDRKNAAYISPINNQITTIFAKRFPNVVVLRRGRGPMPARTYYTMFNRDLLETAFQFFHLSTTHIKDDISIRDTDFCKGFDPEQMKSIARQVFLKQPELFQGKLKGTNAVPRATLDFDIWEYEHLFALEEVLPHEKLHSGIVFDERGLEAVIKVVVDAINQRYGTNLSMFNRLIVRV